MSTIKKIRCGFLTGNMITEETPNVDIVDNVKDEIFAKFDWIVEK